MHVCRYSRQTHGDLQSETSTGLFPLVWNLVAVTLIIEALMAGVLTHLHTLNSVNVNVQSAECIDVTQSEHFTLAFYTGL